jgi:CRP-like cAMP-binding protein
LILRGFAFRQNLLCNGSRQINSIHIPTEFVDLQNGLLITADHNVQAIDGCEAAIVPRDALVELAFERPAIRKAMWIETLLDASIFREWVVNVGRRDSRIRLAHLLCELVVRLRAIGADNDGMYDFPLTQERLADANGPYCGSHQSTNAAVAARGWTDSAHGPVPDRAGLGPATARSPISTNSTYTTQSR